MSEVSWNWVGYYYELLGDTVVEYCPLPAFCLTDEPFDLESFKDF